jgi:hypothetical protein
MTEEILEVHSALREWTRRQTDFGLRLRGHTVERNLIKILEQPDNAALREITARNVADLAEAVIHARGLERALARFVSSK